MQYPELINKITRLQLEPSETQADIPTIPELCGLMAKVQIHTSPVALLILKAPCRHCGPSNADIICLLVTFFICSKLHEMTLGVSNVVLCSPFTTVDPARQFEASIRTVADVLMAFPPRQTFKTMQNLTVLSILGESCSWVVLRMCFQLKDLVQLKSFSVPFVNSFRHTRLSDWALWYRAGTPRETLPPTSQHLTLYVDKLHKQYLYNWLDEVFCPIQPFAALEWVQLYTVNSLQEHTERIPDPTHEFIQRLVMEEILAKMACWKRLPTNILTFFLPAIDYDLTVLEDYEEKDWHAFLSELATSSVVLASE